VDRIEKDPLQKRLERTNWILLAALVGSSLFLYTTRITLGILCGGLISIVNFHWLYMNLASIFARHPEKAKKAILLRFYLRLAVTGLVLFWIISGSLVDIIGLIIGLSVVSLNITLTTVLFLSKKNHLEEVR